MAQLTDEGALVCTVEGCDDPGPFEDLRRLRVHEEGKHNRRTCPHCGGSFAAAGAGPHIIACAKRTAAERLTAGRSSGGHRAGRRVRPHHDDQDPAAQDEVLEALPRWLDGLTCDADLAGRLLEFVTTAYTAGNLTAGMAVVCGPSWGPNLVRLGSLPAMASGHRDAAIIVLDAAVVAHELTAALEAADAEEVDL